MLATIEPHGTRYASFIGVRSFSPNQRLMVTGATCSLLIISAGIAAFNGGRAIVLASVLLSVSVLVGAIGTAYSRDRELGWGLALLAAAGLPLFYFLYAAGVAIFEEFGAVVAGGLLVILGVGVASGTAVVWFRDIRRRLQHRRA